MADHNDQHRRNQQHVNEVVSEVANALQASVPLIDRLRVTSRQQTQDCNDARIALDRAVTALRRLAPEGGAR